MTKPQLTFEHGGEALRILCDLSEPWRLREKGSGYYYRSDGRLSFRDDNQMNVQLQLRPDRFARSLQTGADNAFPEDLTLSGKQNTLEFNVRDRKLDVLIDLKRGFIDRNGNISILDHSQRPGFKLDFELHHNRLRYYVTILVYLVGWNPSNAKTTWEYDLLPFWCGGLPELGKRR